MAEIASQALQLNLGNDPASAIRLQVANFLDGIEIGGEDLLVGIFIPDANAKTAGNIILPEQYLKEYRWQGTAGLVLKIGPLAYNTEETKDWYAKAPAVGDWVMFDVKTGHQLLLGKQPCRLVPARYILGKLANPMLVF
jgi:co-chaperonin GroES (HSP10)